MYTLVDSVLGRAWDVMTRALLFPYLSVTPSRTDTGSSVYAAFLRSGRVEHEPINGVDVNFLM